MLVRRTCAALTAFYTLAAPCLAQVVQIAPPPVTARPSAMIRLLAPPRPATPPRFLLPQGDLRAPGVAPRNGLIATYPIAGNVQIGVGRYRMRGIAEPPIGPDAAARRERGVAAVGISLNF
jgi:hypothetical protein